MYFCIENYIGTQGEDLMELFIMIVYTQQICNISAFNIHVCETIVDQDQQRL